MPSDDQDLITRAHELFAKMANSWRDYVLVADIDPPRIVRVSPLGLLDIHEEALAEACRQILIENGAQTFANFDEFKSVHGWQVPEDRMITYESPAGFYTVEHPANWKIKRDENIVNILPPEGGGEITISAFHGSGASPMALNGLMQRVFKNYEVVSPMRPLSQNNWDGLQAELLQKVETGLRSWLVIGACYRKVLVLITANDTQEAMPSQRHIYESILNSLALSDPEEARV
ncbi:MAG: hypothetical protein ACREFE_02660 [Limisphaerales bacterium]